MEKLHILRCIFYSDVKKIKVDETRIVSVIASLTSKCELDGHFSEIKGPIKLHWFCQHWDLSKRDLVPETRRTKVGWLQFPLLVTGFKMKSVFKQSQSQSLATLRFNPVSITPSLLLTSHYPPDTVYTLRLVGRGNTWNENEDAGLMVMGEMHCRVQIQPKQIV